MADDAGGFTCQNGAPSPAGYSAACDACISSMGCNEYCTCAADSTPPDDAGVPGGCVGYVDCVITCFDQTDAGIMGCAQLCGGAGDGGAFTANQVSEGNQLIAVLSGCQAICAGD
jgi:hypothetical protein